MLLPAPGHSNTTLAQMAQVYEGSAPLVNENKTTSLGLVVAIALVAMTLFWLTSIVSTSLQAGPPSLMARRVRVCGFCAIASFMYGTIGGIGSVFAFGVTPYIRSTNRIVVFIAYFVIAAATMLLSRLQSTGAATGTKQSREGAKPFHLGGYLILLAVLLWDLHDTSFFPSAPSAQAQSAQDATFFHGVEAALPPGSTVFQLPYVAFPEGGFQQLDYSQMIPYVHTERLRFSFGAMRMTEADANNQQMSNLFATDDWAGLASRLRKTGFSHVLINQHLPLADAPLLLDRMQTRFGDPIAQSIDMQFVLYAVPESG